MRLLPGVLLVLLVACGGRRASAPANPVLTSDANATSLCRTCSGGGNYCELLVGSGPEGGTPSTSASCKRLPEACEDETDCGCFDNLKGCRCSHASFGFVTECPAP